MRFSLSVTAFPDDDATAALPAWLAGIATAADGAGIDTVWVADHLLQADPSHAVDDPVLEAFTTLGFLAHATTRVRLGTMVAAATYRAPALLIKAVSTLDVLSGGRAWLGVGAGYQQDEAQMMGLDLPAVGVRFARLAETLELATRMFAGDDRPFLGDHHRLTRPLNHPLPARRPRVLVGGGGERRTLPLVARYADACNLFDVPDGGATLRHKLEVLRGLLEDEGRDPGVVDRTVSTRWDAGGEPDDLLVRMDELEALGLTHAVLVRSAPWTAADVDALGAVVERAATG